MKQLKLVGEWPAQARELGASEAENLGETVLAARRIL